MEDWYRIVRNMKDESEDPFMIQQITHKIHRDIRTRKIKEQVKFRERMGVEFNKWIASMYQQFPTDIVNEIIQDEVFWEATLKFAHT
jgi:hypothetical protein